MSSAQIAPVRSAGRATSVASRALSAARRNGIVIALALTWVVLALASPYFLTKTNLTTLGLQIAVAGIAAAGVTLVVLVAEIDLSIGAVEAFAGALAAHVAITLGAPWPIGVAAALLLGLVIGAANGLLVTTLRMQSFIVTLGTLGIAQGLALVITDGQSVMGFPSAYLWIGQGKLAGIPFPLYVMAVVFVVLWAVLRFTRFGYDVYSIGGNAEAARLAGLRPATVKCACFVISGGCAAIAGVILSARLGAGSGTSGVNDLLIALAAVVIGGTSLTGGIGSVGGTFAGILLIGSITNGLDLLDVSTFWQQVVIGMLIIVAVGIDRVASGPEVRR